ncbi:MAG: aminotransferase class I/II-fold pyridoxal phosphate-dependent enzyme [Muribaculaceae bacterium]|nr:aminotransferase class I/II-fold pyridoxal phosphate-dependent enzyme [Muribaculaceae bacterium]
MISFESDYNNGCHPKVLQHLVETNSETSASYGDDVWSASAREKITSACDSPQADVFFLVGGTQTNATVISALLAPYEGVVAVDTAHINVHESGAIEGTGHKVLALPNHGGKMDPDELDALLAAFHADPNRDHMVWPGMVYLTFPTELGTLYTAHDIERIHATCRRYDIPLYVDGARLGYGLMAEDCDFDLPWLARHCDAFYIGGTKMGALCGEAVVFPRGNAPAHFFTHVKRQGALLAKSRLAGVQFDALFTDGLYFDIARHALNMAARLRQLFLDRGYTMTPSTTNQQFVFLSDEQVARIAQHVAFELWERPAQGPALYRFVTSWATTDAHLAALATALESV